MADDFLTDDEILKGEVTPTELDEIWDEDDEIGGAPKNETTKKETKPTPDTEEESSDDEEEEEESSGDEESAEDEESEGDSEEEDEESSGDSDESDSEDEEEGESEDGESDSEDEEDEESETEDDDITLAESIEKEGKALLKKQQEAEDSDEAEAEAELKASRKAHLDSLVISKKDLEDMGEELGAIQFPDEEVEVDGIKVNLGTFAKDYPEAVAMTKALTLHSAKKLTSLAVERLEGQLNRERFFNELSGDHPDIRKIQRDPKFQTWMKDASDATKAMLMDDENPENVSKAVSLYKESLKAPAKKKKTVAKKNIETRKKKTRLLSKNVSGKKKTLRKKGYDKTDQSDAAADAWWDEDDD